MTRCAVVGKELRTDGIGIALAAERKHLLRQRTDLRRAEGFAKAGHQAGARLRRGLPTYAVRDRGLDRLENAAPQPVVIVKVRVSRRSGRPGPMALHAIDIERSAAPHSDAPPRG